MRQAGTPCPYCERTLTLQWQRMREQRRMKRDDAAIAEYREQGKSIQWIANRLGIDRSTVYKGLKERRHEEV